MPNRRSSTLKLFAIAAGASLVILAGLWTYQRSQARGQAPRLDEIIERSKQTPLNDRQAWLRLARQMLAVENVQPLVAVNDPLNNRGHAQRAELGRLLFFDPLLSGDRRTSCASCHHPDYGMADGLPRAIGVGGHGIGPARAGTGPELRRNTPSIFNVSSNNLHFWDGSAGTLEEQALAPIFAENEMHQSSAAELIHRLRAISEYRARFAAAFGFETPPDGRDITLPNIARAIAAFERKLTLTETNYDRFVAGRDDQLTTEQARGLMVFFGPGQCAACHTPPLFHDGSVSALGVPASAEKGAPLDSDPGFGAVNHRVDDFGMFKTPALRNVSRTAPYMHNGIFATLEEVVDFYNDGGGRGRGLNVPNQDFKVTKLNLTEQQKRDLVSFLKALDDLTPPPLLPASLPSGLPVARGKDTKPFLQN
jgi:cytochrome c peroxidase